MYKGNDWEDRRNWKLMYTKPESVPGHANWPHQKEHEREKTDYFHQNFKKSELYAANTKATAKADYY